MITYSEVLDRRNGHFIGFIADTVDSGLLSTLGYARGVDSTSLGCVFGTHRIDDSVLLMSNDGEVFSVVERDHMDAIARCCYDEVYAIPFKHDDLI